MTGFITEPLRRDHDRTAFRCGNDALDRYLRELAFQDIERRLAACFVVLDDSGKVAGYYTLAATSVALDALPDRMKKRLPRYRAVPAILIGRLAVDLSCQGQGLGSALIIDAVTRTDRLGIGATALIIDTKDDGAKAFYAANGFVPIADETRRMVLPIATALAAIRR